MKFLMRSVASLILVLVLLVAMFPVRAFAIEYLDYNDYITDVQVDGEKDLVTVSFPQRYSYIWVNEHGNLLSYGSGGELYVELAGGSTARYDIGFRPLGSDGYLLLDNIPNGTQITQAFTVSISNTSSGIVTPLYSVYTDYRGADGPLGDQLLMSDYVSWFEKQIVTWTVGKPSGATGMRPFVWLQNVYFMDANQQVTITLEPMVMTMSISSLYRLQEETGKTNDLLQLVLEKLGQIEQENLTWYERIWKAITDGFESVLSRLDLLIGGSGDGSDILEEEIFDNMQNAADNVSSAVGGTNEVISSGSNVASGIVTGEGMAATITTLGSCMSIFFTGNEITLCGVTFNPWDTAVCVFGGLGLISLMLAYVFRKRGGG